MNRLEQKISAEASKPEESYALNPLDEIFKGDPDTVATKFEKLEQQEIEKADETGTNVQRKKFTKKKPKKHFVGKKNKNKKTTTIAKKIKN